MSFSMENVQHHWGLAPGLGFNGHCWQPPWKIICYILSPKSVEEGQITYISQQNTILGKSLADATDTSVIQMCLNLFLLDIASSPSLFFSLSTIN